MLKDLVTVKRTQLSLLESKRLKINKEWGISQVRIFYSKQVLNDLMNIKRAQRSLLELKSPQTKHRMEGSLKLQFFHSKYESITLVHSKWNGPLPNGFFDVIRLLQGAPRWSKPHIILQSASKVLQSFKTPPKAPNTSKSPSIESGLLLATPKLISPL